MGDPVRYNGSDKLLQNKLMQSWRSEGRLVPVCPELLSGFAVPRPCAEISKGHSGEEVVDGFGRVMEETGKDVTGLFLAGANAALQIALQNDCHYALLTDGSPSCGSSYIYDGSFGGKKLQGVGVVTALLERNGIRVFCEGEIERLGRNIA